MAGLVGAVAGVVDDASAFLRDNQNEFTFNTSVLEDTTDAREKISILGQGVAGRGGRRDRAGRALHHHTPGRLRLYVYLPVNVARGLVRAAASMTILTPSAGSMAACILLGLPLC